MPILISIERAAKRQERIHEQGIDVELLKESVDGLKLNDPKSYLSPRAYYDFDKKKNRSPNNNKYWSDRLLYES